MYHEKWHFKALVLFTPIYVVDAKIIFIYNFGDPLSTSSLDDAVDNKFSSDSRICRRML